MGCQNSRLYGNGGEIFQTKLRPLINRRLEELRKRKGGTPIPEEEEEEESTFSKKQLLIYDGADDDNSRSSDESDSENSKGFSKNTQSSKRLSKVVPLPVSEYGTKGQHNDHDQDNVEKKDQVEPKMEKVKIARPQPQNEHEYDHIENGRNIAPGSPSFKIYCTEDEKRKEKSSENQTIGVLEKSSSADSVESFALASGLGSSNDVVEIRSASKKKGNKKKKLGTMKKNIFHIKDLHMNRLNPMTCGNSRRNILEN